MRVIMSGFFFFLWINQAFVVMTLNVESSPQPGVWTSETNFGDGAQASLNLTVFLSLPSKCWDDRCVSSHLAQGFLQ